MFKRARSYDIEPEVIGEWLRHNLEPGDLVFTACADPASKLIRWGTQSNYSHVAVCVDRGLLVEAYDKGMTLDETDGGVYALSFEQFASRGRVTRVGSIRPKSIDVDALLEAANHSVAHSPSYASFGAAVMAVLGLTARVNQVPRYRFGTISILGAGLVMRLLADGPSRVHCAEFVARLIGTGNEPPRFDHIRLQRLAGVASRDIQPLEGLPPRSAGVAQQSRPSQHALALVQGLRARVTERSRGDVSDFVVPADLWDSPSFDVVFELKGRAGGHIESLVPC